MKIRKATGTIFLICIFFAPAIQAYDPVKGSSEDLYWEDPMTIHDFKRKSDLHCLAVSAAAITELQFVRLGDGLINLTARNNKSPISRSLDSLEFAYSKLPQIEPVRRIGQLFNALQLRQISLSDARIAGSILLGGFGGVTPVMQVRVYNVVVWVEDVVYDLDKAIMFPFNWGISSLREKPTHLKGIGYVADGLGYARWKISAGVKYINKKIARFSSDVVLGVEKIHDSSRRRKRRKLNGEIQIYARMPFSVFQENRSFFTGKKANVSASTAIEWSARILKEDSLLPGDVRGVHIELTDLAPDRDDSQAVLLAADYLTWRKTPRELKKYVITPEEFTEFIRAHNVPSSPIVS